MVRLLLAVCFLASCAASPLAHPASVYRFESWLGSDGGASLLQAGSSSMRGSGVRLARARHADLHALAASNPRAALRAMKRLDGARASLPAFLEMHVEQRVDKEASLTVMAYVGRGEIDSKIERAVTFKADDGAVRTCTLAKHSTYVDALPSRTSISAHGYATTGADGKCSIVLEETACALEDMGGGKVEASYTASGKARTRTFGSRKEAGSWCRSIFMSSATVPSGPFADTAKYADYVDAVIPNAAKIRAWENSGSAKGMLFINATQTQSFFKYPAPAKRHSIKEVRVVVWWVGGRDGGVCVCGSDGEAHGGAGGARGRGVWIRCGAGEKRRRGVVGSGGVRVCVNTVLTDYVIYGVRAHEFGPQPGSQRRLFPKSVSLSFLLGFCWVVRPPKQTLHHVLRCYAPRPFFFAPWVGVSNLAHDLHRPHHATPPQPPVLLQTGCNHEAPHAAPVSFVRQTSRPPPAEAPRPRRGAPAAAASGCI